MPTNFDLIRKRNNIPIRENREASAVKTENRGAVLPKTERGGIDWGAIRKRNGIGVENSRESGSSPPERAQRQEAAGRPANGNRAGRYRPENAYFEELAARKRQTAGNIVDQFDTSESYGETLKKQIAALDERLTLYANRGRILGQSATQAEADAWKAQKTKLENDYAAWERGMYSAAQKKALSALPDGDLKLIDQYLEEKRRFDPVETALDPLGVSGGNSASYRTLLQKYGYDETQSLIEYRERQKNELRQRAINETVANYASSGAWQGVAASAASVVTKALSVPGMLASAVKAGMSPNSHAGIDINNPLNTMQNFTSSSRGGVSNAILGGDPENASFGRQAGNLLYQTLMSGIDSAVAMAMGGQSAGGYLLGATAATNAMQDITERGGTLEQAVMGSIASGVFECLFEDVSIGNFYQLKETANVRGIRDLLLNMGKSALVNASEEGATELANILYDSIMLGDISNVSIRLRELMAAGMTEQEAKRALAAELGAQIGESALSGALMGLFFGGVGSLENYVRSIRASSGSTGVNANTSTAFDAEPLPITLPTAEETMNRQAAQNADVQYSLEEIDGRIMPVIDTKNDTRKFDAAETYLKTLVDTQNPFATILSDAQPVYIGKDLPGEYLRSKYTEKMRSSLREVKRQATTNLDEMLLLAENGEWRENVKDKHSKDAANGWYRYDTEFAVPSHDRIGNITGYTVYDGVLLIRNDADGKSYLYDLIDVNEKKKASSSPSSTAGKRSEIFEPGPSSNPTISQPDSGVKPSIPGRNETDTYDGPRPITLPTAEQDMTQRRARSAETELERSGILAGAQDSTIAEAQRISRAIGRDIAFYNEAATASGIQNGYYNPGDGKIYVNAASGNPVAQIIAHEMTHSVELAESYSELADVVLKRIGQTEDLPRLRRQKEELYEKNGVQLRGEAEIDQEIVAEYVERHLLTDEASILELTHENRTLGERILAWINRLLAKMGNSRAQERAFLTQARDAYAKALRQTNSNTAAAQQQTAREDAIQSLREEYADGTLSEEAFYEALDAVMEEESAAGESMLEGRFSISEGFADEIDAWDGRSRETFRVGTVSDALKSIGVKDNRIVWHSGKIAEILRKHRAMDKNTIKQVPQVLEHPIVVLKSKNVDSRILMFGEIVDNAGKPVTAVLELLPTNKDGEALNLNEIASAYGKDNIKNFMQRSDVLYLDPDKNRTDTWLQSVGLQLPSDTTTYGSIGTIAYQDGKVKIAGVPYEQYMQGSYFAERVGKSDTQIKEKFSITGERQDETAALKEAQFRVIQQSNPANDDYHTWIRGADEIHTLEEVLRDPDWDYDEFNPDYTRKMAEKALKTGKIRVFSSYPVSDGVFVTPSAMEAMSYSGHGQVYSKTVDITDVAWIDPTQGQYAPVDDTTDTLIAHALRLPTAADDVRYSLTAPPNRGAQQGAPDAPYDDRGERWDGTFRETGDPAAAQPNDVEAADAGEPPRAELPTARDTADPASELPAKAQRYLQRVERYIINKAGGALGVPYQAGYGYLNDVAREISNEYLEKGRVSDEVVNRTFAKAYEGSVLVNRAYYEAYKDLLDSMHSKKLVISPEDSKHIPNFDGFRKRYHGSLDISAGDGANIEEAFLELHKERPGLFDIRHAGTPAEQLQRIAQVSESIETAKHSLEAYEGPDANECRRWAKNDFEAAVNDVLGELRLVKRFADESNAENTEARPLTEKELPEMYGKLKTARRNSEKAVAQNLLTQHDETQVGRLLRGEIELEHLNPAKDNVRGITAVYEAKREYEQLAKRIHKWNQSRKADLRAEADRYLQTANDWKDKKAGFLYSRETMERNIRDIVKDQDVAEQIIDKYFKPVHDAAADANRTKNAYRDRVRALKLSRKVAEGNTVSEAHAVQLLGEAEDNIRMLEQSKGMMKERDGKTLKEWRDIVQEMWRENQKLDEAKIRAAVSEFRSLYDELFEQMNETRIRNGYEPVNYRRGYFPHFQPGTTDGLLAQFGKALGIDAEVTALPTTINGLTHTFRPGIRWFGNAQERLGFNTAYDAVEGFDKYIEGVADVVHQTDNIQRLRALAAQIRYRTGDEGIREQVDAVRANPSLSEEDRQNRLEKIYESGRYTLSNFVVELEEYTNLLANKKSRADRNMEQAAGRRVYNVMKALESRVAANMVAVNPASWLTNFIPLTQGAATLDRGMVIHGMWDTLKAYYKADGFVNRSSFLTNRRGSDPIVKTWAQAASAKMSSPMEFIDQFTADSLVRARYRQNLKRGLSEAAAMSEADAWAAGVMADRSKGSMPTIFYRSNPVTKVFTQFQLEVNNQLSYLFKDIPREAREKGLKVIAAMLFKFFLGAFLYNEVYEWFIGRRPALDPLGILNDTVGDITGYELPNLIDLGVGAITGDMPSFEVEQKNAYGVVSGLLGNVAEEAPFIGGVLGGGRVPVSSALPDWENLGKAILNDNWSSEKRLATAAKELGNPLTYLASPFGGGQLKKIYQGLKATIKGGSYSVDTDGNEILQYPVYNDTAGQAGWNAARSILFGKASIPTARDWIDRGFKSLGAKETACYQGMTEAGVPGKLAYTLLQTLSGVEKTDTESEAVQKRRLLAEAKISDEGKSVVYYGLMASDKERELMDQLVDSSDMGEVASVLMEIKDAGKLTGSTASNAKRDAIRYSSLPDREKKQVYRYMMGTKQDDGSYASSRDDDIAAFEQAGMKFDQFLQAQNQYASIDEKFDSASEKAVEFSRWVNTQMLTANQADTMRDSFRYFSQIPQEADRYEKLMDAGLSDDDAYKLANALAELTPEPGKKQVSDYQRYEAIIGSGLKVQDQISAIGSIMGTELLTESGNPSQYAKLLSVLDAGAQLREWLAASRFEAGAETDYDANGKIVKSAKEKVVEYIDGLDVAGEVKDAFYLCWYAESGLSKTPWHSLFGAIQLPTFTLPEFKLPELPEFEIPEINLPSLTLPKM